MRVACETKPSPDNQRKQEEEITIQPVHTQPGQPCEDTRESRKGLEGNPCLSIEELAGNIKEEETATGPHYTHREGKATPQMQHPDAEVY